MMQTRNTCTCPLRDFLRNTRVEFGRAFVALALLLTFAFPVPARAQCPGGWLPGQAVPGVSGNVRALAVLPGGDVIAGGSFTTAGGVAASYIARYNPSTGVWSALGSGMNRAVFDLAVLPGGDVIAGGWFTQAGGNVSAYFARYAFATIPAPSISGQPASKTVCASGSAVFSVTAAGIGPFTYQWRKGGAPINSSAGAGGNPSAATATLTLMNVQPTDSGVYDCIVTNACGSITSNSATLTIQACTGCSLADIAGGGPDGLRFDGLVDSSDFTAFINSFCVGDPTINPLADVAGTGDDGLSPDGIIDGNDFIAFINAFSAGC